MSGTSTPPANLAPPIQSPPLNQDALSSQPWLEYHQGVADKLSLAQMRKGVTDGSDAAAGDIGEYMSASASVPLSNAVAANVVSLSLTAGDWDVAGNVVFSPGSGAHSFFAVGVGTIDTYLAATFSTAVINQALSTATHRYNVTGATTVWVVAEAHFAGTMSAAGSIWARRAR